MDGRSSSKVQRIRVRPGAESELSRALLALAPLNALAYLVLQDPQGQLGARDTMTAAGYGLSGLLLLGGLLLWLEAHRSPRRARRLGLLLCLVAGLPFLVSSSPDLVVRPAGLSLDLWLAHRCLSVLPEPAESQPVRLPWLNLLLFTLLLLLVGYEFSGSLWAHLCLGMVGLLALDEARSLSGFGSRVAVALALPPLAIPFAPALAFLAIALAQVAFFFHLGQRYRLVQSVLESLYRRPAQMLAASFALLILVGTLLLSFPRSAAPGRTVDLLDAFFTATSATCVTGLIVLDTPNDFSLFGQAVILVLLQIGGLGMITVSSFASLLLGRRIGLRVEAALGELFEARRSAVLFELIRFIVLGTLAVEGIGVLLLAHVFLQRGHGLGESLWLGVFHSVSAFCNAGFALFSDSLAGCADSSLAVFTISGLVITGGIGFGVLSILYRRIRRPEEVLRFPVHVRLSLLGTAVLLAAGTGLILVLEWSRSLAALGPLHRVTNAFFQSMTCRTAGFNTVDLGQLQLATVFLMVLLMFIGACSNSTGGGVKVTTVLVLFCTVSSVIRGRNEVEAMGRTIPRSTVYKCTVIITLALLFVSLGILALLATQKGPFHWIVFEAFSAFGTVGLSLGMTGQLDSFGKMIVIILMYVGRIGPLGLALLLESKDRRAYRLPEGNVLVG